MISESRRCCFRNILMDDIRVGSGFDVHAFAEGRPLILGGVHIPDETGLAGHSDADVLLHAIADALLGAAGLPDIGHYFPPGDPRYKDADSQELLQQVHEFTRQEGFGRIVNIDATVIAEEPKLRPYIEQMKNKIAKLLAVEDGRIGIKATTTEELGFIGRKEGIAAIAVVLVARNA